MMETDARAAVESLVGAAAFQLLDRFNDRLIAENERQNLIARSTIPVIWQRHFLDSIQLIPWVEAGEGLWIDIGSGGGFPGIVVAIARPGPIVLVEPRRQRAAFLSSVINDLGLTNATVMADRVERMPAAEAMTISARAVAPIGTLFALAGCHINANTTFLLPRGAGWSSDVETAKKKWNATFHVEQSVSDSAARIVIAREISRR